MTPLFLDQCPRKNLMWENWCNYLRVFLLSNFRVKSGCQIRLNPMENALGSSTSQSETNVPLETSDKPSDNSSAPIFPRNPNVCLFGLCQPLSAQRWPCVTLNRCASASGSSALAFWPSLSATLASLKHCAAPGCLCVALREPWLLLRHFLWLLR